MADELSLTPAQGLRVAWDRATVAALPTADGEPEAGWRLEGSLDPGFSTLRVVSGATAEGSLLLLCAARPSGAAHHDEESVAALLVGPDGEVQIFDEPLLSTEYAADGSIRRLGLELYKPGDDYPVRGAGDAIHTSSHEGDGERRRVAQLSFRLDGSEGVALYEIIQRV